MFSIQYSEQVEGAAVGVLEVEEEELMISMDMSGDVKTHLVEVTTIVLVPIRGGGFPFPLFPLFPWFSWFP